MNKLLVIIGPTATNKTALSIKLANTLNGEIINADAFQVYKELNIGVNKPTKTELQQANFHLIDYISVNDKWDIKRFQEEAKKIIKTIYENNKLPILVGGSHLYVDALVKNYDLSNTNERDDQFDNFTNQDLFDKLNLINNELAKKITINNRKRLVRALQVLSKNNSMNKCNAPIYDVLYICCSKPREILYEDINKRVDWMISHGWFEEVNELIKHYDNYKTLNAFKAIGYSIIADGLVNPIKGIDIDKIKQLTRNYAKRQLTWIKHHYPEAIMFNQDNIEEVTNKINEWLKK